MLARRALARTLAVVVGSLAVMLGVLAVPSAYASGFAATSSTPAAGAIVKPAAVTAQAPIEVCFSAPVNPLTSTLSLAGPGGAVTGVSAPANCEGGTGNALTFLPTTLPLPDGDYIATYSAADTTPVTPQTASGSWAFRIDGTAPATPTISTTSTGPINAINENSISVVGTAEPSHAQTGVAPDQIQADPITATLTVHSPAGGSDVTATTTTDNAGNYSFSAVDVSGLTDSASVTYSVTATDKAGNVSTAATKTVVKDTSPAVLSSSTPADGTTHQPTDTVAVTFSQPLDTANSSAAVSNGVGTELAQSSKVFSNGDMTMTVTLANTLAELGNPYAVTYTVHDVNGNVTTGTIHFTIDNIPPGAPTQLNVPTYINSLNVSAVSVSGNAEPGSSVFVSMSDGSHTVSGSDLAGNDGSFTVGSIDATSLVDKDPIDVSVTATDAAGNTSAPATATTIKDTVAPAQPGAVTFPTAVNNSNQTAVPISGSVAADVARVDVSVDDANPATSPVTASLTPDGSNAYSTSLDLSSLDEGTLTATVTGFDAAGNPSPAQTATATKDSGVPAAPIISIAPKPYINAAQAATVTVSGTAENASTVHLSVDDQDPTTNALAQDVTANASTGAYTATFDVSGLTDGTLTVTGTVEDAAHNVSLPATDSSTLDQQAPGTPSVTAPPFANSANVASYTVAGVAEPGSVVKLTYTDSGTGQVLDSTTANGTTGDWSVSTDLTSLAEGALTLVVTATDAAGNNSAADTEHPTKDTSAPSAPVVTTYTHPIDTTNDTAVDVAGADGSAEPGSTVTVSIDDDSAPSTPAVTGSVLATGTGSYDVSSLNVSQLNDSTLTFSVTATDAAGNVSTVTQETAVKDTTALALLTRAPALSPTKSPAAIVLNYNEPVDPSAITIVVDDNTSSAAAGTITFSNGNRTVTFTPGSAFSEAASPYAVTADAHDPAGDHDVTQFSFTVDDTPPGQPSITSMTDPVNAGNVDAVGIAGTADANTSLTVDVTDGTNDVVWSTTADGTGAWSLTGQSLTGLAEGTISATAVATDFAGNNSVPSTAFTATKDTVVPAKPVVTSVTHPVNAANDSSVSVSGASEPGSTVAVDISDGTAHVRPTSVVAGSGGTWSVTGVDVRSLSDGTLSVTSVATDAAGNQSVASSSVTALKDTVVPAKPVVSSVTHPVNAANASSVSVSGTSEPASLVHVDITDGVKHLSPSATTDGSGNWSITGIDTTTLADGSITITATAVDAVGNTSAASDPSVVSKATVLPGTPGVRAVVPGDASLAISWSAPTTGAPASSYTVSVSPHAGGTTTTFTTPDATTTSHTFGGLTNGTLYDVSVAANNAAGRSQSASAAATPRWAATLTLTDTARKVVYGAKITLSGQLTRSDGQPDAGASVRLFRTLDGGTAAVYRTLTTDAAGHWSTTFAPAANASYFASFIGDVAVSPATSGAARTTVAPRVRIWSPLNRSTSSSATVLRVTGKVAPNKAGRAVVLYYVTKTGRLVKLTAARLSSKSTYVLTYRLKRGTWRLRVVIGASSGNVAGTSSTLTVKRT